MKERKWKSILSQLTEGVLILEIVKDSREPKVLFRNTSLSDIVRPIVNKEGFSSADHESNFILEELIQVHSLKNTF